MKNKKSDKYFNRKAIYNNPKFKSTLWSQGRYRVKNKAKCKNVGGVINYKSALEAQFCYMLDIKKKNVISWGYETLVIRYKSDVDNKFHSYMMDFIFDVRLPNGSVQKYLVEIKPSKEKEEIEYYWKTGKPIKRNGNMKASSWVYKKNAFITNVNKWDYAKKLASRKGYIFLVVTEKDLLK